MKILPPLIGRSSSRSSKSKHTPGVLQRRHQKGLELRLPVKKHTTNPNQQERLKASKRSQEAKVVDTPQTSNISQVAKEIDTPQTSNISQEAKVVDTPQTSNTSQVAKEIHTPQNLDTLYRIDRQTTGTTVVSHPEHRLVFRPLSPYEVKSHGLSGSSFDVVVSPNASTSPFQDKKRFLFCGDSGKPHSGQTNLALSGEAVETLRQVFALASSKR